MSLAVSQFSTWVACIGFTLGFGGMFLKTWRVHKIFVNRTKKMVSENDVFLKITVIMATVQAFLGMSFFPDESDFKTAIK